MKKIREEIGEVLLNSIKNGVVSERPNELLRFLIFSYADIKAYKYHYWCLFPSFKETPHWIVKDLSPAESLIPSGPILSQIREFLSTADYHQRPFFLLIKSTLDEWTIAPLKELSHCVDKSLQFYLVAEDSVQLADYPSWPVRNILAFAFIKFKLKVINLFLYRDGINSDTLSKSILIKVEADKDMTLEAPLSIVGWERNGKGVLGPRVVNLSTVLDPFVLSESASTLNLSLMRWRLVPQLDLDRIQNSKCLLLGAGTLGCGVARNLLSWGVRHVTFVDYSTVSYSNPVRQSLFTFEDCKRKLPKAECAAQRLKEIYPNMFSTGYNISIPMLGHPIYEADIEKTMHDYETLENLISTHDAIFLLTDTRESRWLPTVISTAMDKLLINSALGFDSWLVMRHGSVLQKENRLGCYFCNDIFAPSNSLVDRTLDQTCTVTRSGCANIATAIAVELFVSLLQHPNGHAAPVLNEDQTVLGELPHQIRGFLHNFSLMKISGMAYPQCSACSECIINEWNREKWMFVLRAINEPDYVEELCGLREVQALGEIAGTMEEWIDRKSVV